MKTLKREVDVWRRSHPLALYLEQEGITQGDLAALLGVTQVSIRSWLAGAAISDKYLVRFNELISGFDEKVEAWRQASPLMKQR
jgi:plasmid maintenance system antidote protein VapI